MSMDKIMRDNFEQVPNVAYENEVVAAILGRRAVRTGFTDADLNPDIVQIIVGCGLSAPSSKNAQPWKLHIVTSRETLKDVSRDVLLAKTASRFVPHDPVSGKPREDFDDTVDESAHVLGNVPLGIFIEDRGVFSVNRQTIADVEKNKVGAIFGFGLEYIGLGACIENMWLAAEAQGLRAVFMGDAAIAEEQIRTRFEMDGDFIGVLAVGHTLQPPSPKKIEENLVKWH